MIDAFTTKNVWIQTKKHPYESEYVNIQQIVEKVSSNLHLNEMSLNKIGNLLQILFIVTGCDYVSYFKNHPKTPMYNCFFDNINFICKSTGQLCTITLDETSCDSYEHGFISFGYLIGCVYFKGCANCYIKEIPDRSAHSLFKHVNKDVSDINNESAFRSWLDEIRKATIKTKKSEEFYLPSYECLKSNMGF